MAYRLLAAALECGVHGCVSSILGAESESVLTERARISDWRYLDNGTLICRACVPKFRASQLRAKAATPPEGKPHCETCRCDIPILDPKCEQAGCDQRGARPVEGRVVATGQACTIALCAEHREGFEG